MATASNLSAGSYICNITDKINNKTSVVVNVVEPSTKLVISTVDSVAVNGNCNGSATVSATGGNPSYTYFWNDNLHQTTTQATNLCSGTVKAVVTDTWGCKDSVQIIIDDVTSINDLSKMNIKVVPNPANSSAVIFIESKQNDLINALILDEAGRVVHESNFGSMQKSAAYTINVEQLSSGTYFIKVNNSMSSAYYKLLVTH